MNLIEEDLSRRSLLKAAGIGALMLPWLAGCGSDSTPATQGAGSGSGSGSGSQADLGKVTLPAPSLSALLGNAPLHVAAAQGFFGDAGLTVELADVIGTDVIRFVQTQSVIGVAGTIPVAVAFSKGVKDLRIIAPMYSAAQTTFIAPANSKVKTITDLKPGMKIGGSIPSTPPDYFASELIRKAGLEPGSDITIVDLGRAPDAWTAAQKGLVDLTWSNPPFDTPLISSGQAVRVASAADLVPAWVDTCLTTTQAKVDSQGAVLRAVVEGIAKAHALLRDDPAAAADAWAQNARIDPAIAAAALKDAPGSAWSSTFDQAGLQACVKAGRDRGTSTGDGDLNTLVSTKFV